MMLTGLCIFAVLTIACGFVALDNDSVGIAMLGIVFSFFSGVALIVALEDENSKNVPTAIEVYQGKTTLQVTYKDSVAVDSIVVYK